jgi:hypothetical protein
VVSFISSPSLRLRPEERGRAARHVRASVDEMQGLATAHCGAETMTASPTVDLRALAYVGATLTQRAWVERRDGRRWFVRGEFHEGERLLAEAHGLWLVPRAT